jgi:hypothetical protein
MSQPCASCDFDILDTAYCCTRCADGLSKRLLLGGELYIEMAVAIARQVKFGDPIGRGRSEMPLPFDWDKSVDRSAVDNVVTTWARHITAETGAETPRTIGEVMRWLADPHQINWLRYRQEAAEAFDELDYAARLVIRCVDSPSQRWYAGPCTTDGCTEDLYGRPNATTLRCRECRTEHDAQARRDWLLKQADDVLGTATEVARFASAMRGESVTAASIRGLAFRGRIEAKGVDRKNDPTYRVGDVLIAIERMAA